MAIGLVERAATGIAVQSVGGVNQLAVIVSDVRGGILGRLLIAAEQQDQIPAGHEALGLQAQKDLGNAGDAALDVVGSAAEEIVALLRERKWIALPVFRLGRDHVHVGQCENRLAAGAVAP